MKPIVKLFLRVLLHVIVIYTVLLLLFKIVVPFDMAIWQYLIMSLAVGVPLAVIFTSMQVDNLQRMGITSLTSEHLSIEQSDEFWSHSGLSEIEDTLREKERFSNARFSREGKELEIRTRSLWALLGEKVTLRIVEADENRFKYEVESKPVLPIISLDYGRNLKNVMLIKKWMGD